MENKNHIILYSLVFLLIGLVLGSPFEVPSDGHYRILTIDSDYIDVSLSGFPLLVVLDNNSGNYNFHNNGADIRFCSTDFSVNFSYEIASFNNNGKTYCWVNISESVSSINDYTFCITYDNASLSDNQNVTDVWDSNYLAVWHMNNLSDSTSNNIDLINSGANSGTSGKIDYCFGFVGGSVDYMYHPTFLDTMPSSDILTFECWVYHNSLVSYATYLSKLNIAGQDRFYFRRSDTRKLILQVESRNEGVDTAVDTVNTIENSWYYQVGIYDSGNALVIIRNGTAKTSGGVTSDVLDGTATDFFIGVSDVAHNYPMDGNIDEVRVSDVVRSDSWIKACYHSQNQTNGFLTIGSENDL